MKREEIHETFAPQILKLEKTIEILSLGKIRFPCDGDLGTATAYAPPLFRCAPPGLPFKRPKGLGWYERFTVGVGLVSAVALLQIATSF